MALGMAENRDKTWKFQHDTGTSSISRNTSAAELADVLNRMVGEIAGE